MTTEAEAWEAAQSVLAQQFEADHPFGRYTMKWAVEHDGARGETWDGETWELLVASTPQQRVRGMIGRRFTGFDAMLFVMDAPVKAQFYNRGVHEDLGVAFFDENGRWLRTMKLHANSSDIITCPEDGVKFALEMPYARAARISWSGTELPKDVRVGAVLAQAYDGDEGQSHDLQKRTPDQVNLRPSDPTASESCLTCQFYIANNLCELVTTGAGPGMICDEYTPDLAHRQEDLTETP